MDSQEAECVSKLLDIINFLFTNALLIFSCFFFLSFSVYSTFHIFLAKLILEHKVKKYFPPKQAS